MKTFISAALPAVACAFALSVAGCASLPPPNDQVAVAKASVESANAAGAQTYAPDELRLATEKLASAQQAMTNQDYVHALQLAQQVQADARLAVGKTQSAKARKADDDAQKAAQVLREEMNRNAQQTNMGTTK